MKSKIIFGMLTGLLLAGAQLVSLAAPRRNCKLNNKFVAWHGATTNGAQHSPGKSGRRQPSVKLRVGETVRSGFNPLRCWF
jgi:hypothetical protein